MHDGVPYDPIQGQGQGHECFKATRGVNHQSHLGLIFKNQDVGQLLFLGCIAVLRT